jgi:hypothetical protein
MLDGFAQEMTAADQAVADLRVRQSGSPASRTGDKR